MEDVSLTLARRADAYNSGNNPYYKPQNNWGKLYSDAVQAYEPWDKSDEFEADARGLKIYLELGLDPERYISLFQLLGEWGSGESKTHPRIEERIVRLRAQLDTEHVAIVGRDMDEAEFKLVQSAVSAEVTRLRSLGFLVSNESVLALALTQKERKLKVSACGALDFDPDQENARFDELVERRMAPMGGGAP